MLIGSVAYGADFIFKPSLTVSEEFNDNVSESNNKKEYDFITRILPGIALDYHPSRLDLTGSYAFDYRYYARSTKKEELTHNIVLQSKATLVDNLLFLTVSDTYKKVSLNVGRDNTSESLSVNQSDTNDLQISPYVVLNVTSRTKIQTGYKYRNVWYREDAAQSRTENGAFLSASHELTSKFFLTAEYTFTNQVANKKEFFYLNTLNRFISADSFNRHVASGGFNYEYADKSFIYAKAGNSWINYDSDMYIYDQVFNAFLDQGKYGVDFSAPYWDAGITYTRERTEVSLTTSVKPNTDDPLSNATEETSYTFRVNQTFNRTKFSVGLVHTDYLNTLTDNLEKRKIGGDTSLDYQLFERLRLTGRFQWERYKDKPLNDPGNVQQGGITRKISTGCGLAYQMPHDMNLTVNYQFIDYHSHDNPSENKSINRLVCELQKMF